MVAKRRNLNGGAMNQVFKIRGMQLLKMEMVVFFAYQKENSAHVSINLMRYCLEIVLIITFI